MLARLIDLVIFAAISIGFALINLKHDKNWYFQDNWFFYIWIIFSVIALTVIYLILPVVWNGKTIGMWICRIKIIFEDQNKIHSIFKRELFLSVSWILLLVCVGVFINHTLFDRYARTHQKDVDYTTFETLRISTVTTIASLLTLGQMIVGISIVVRKPRTALHDGYSKTETVWINKMVKIEKPKPNTSVQPRLIKQEKIEWI